MKAGSYSFLDAKRTSTSYVYTIIQSVGSLYIKMDCLLLVVQQPKWIFTIRGTKCNIRKWCEIESSFQHSTEDEYNAVHYFFQIPGPARSIIMKKR